MYLATYEEVFSPQGRHQPALWSIVVEKQKCGKHFLTKHLKSQEKFLLTAYYKHDIHNLMLHKKRRQYEKIFLYLYSVYSCYSRDIVFAKPNVWNCMCGWLFRTLLRYTYRNFIPFWYCGGNEYTLACPCISAHLR